VAAIRLIRACKVADGRGAPIVPAAWMSAAISAGE
jgi:hypothetical protein